MTKTKNYRNNIKSKTQKNKLTEKKLVDQWMGNLLGKYTHIEIFKIPNSNRKPIIKITEKGGFKNVNGAFLALRFLPPIKRPGFLGFGEKTIYRLSLYYQARGSYQGGPKVGFREYLALFSEDEKQIKEIGKMLSKYTKDIMYKKK